MKLTATAMTLTPRKPLITENYFTVGSMYPTNVHD
jgi:hypothetical protein